MVLTVVDGEGKASATTPWSTLSGQPRGRRVAAPTVSLLWREVGFRVIGLIVAEVRQQKSPWSNVGGRQPGRPGQAAFSLSPRDRPGPSRLPLRAAAPALTGPALLVRGLTVYVKWRTLKHGTQDRETEPATDPPAGRCPAPGCSGPG